jgi:predicted nucleic acid-binding protein
VKQREVLIDTGPMVAIVSKDDAHHHQCVAQLEHLRGPFFTTWPVVTEALWLVRRDSTAVSAVFNGFAAGLWALVPLGPESLPWLEVFLGRYRKLGARLADASLVYLAEYQGIDTVFTLDYRDFTVYRFQKNKRLKLIPAIG